MQSLIEIKQCGGGPGRVGPLLPATIYVRNYCNFQFNSHTNYNELRELREKSQLLL